jgi:hypothetical protein
MRRNAMHTLESTYMSWDGAVNCMWRRDRQVGGRMRICMNWYWHWSILNRTCDCDRCTTWPYVTAYSCILITLTTRTGNKHNEHQTHEYKPNTTYRLYTETPRNIPRNIPRIKPKEHILNPWKPKRMNDWRHIPISIWHWDSISDKA